MNKVIASMAVVLVAACGPEAERNGQAVETSEKSEVEIAEVPAEVLAAAKAVRSGFTAKEAERETRDGRRYFDIEGTLADGSEIEFDIMETDGRWSVVETQRDIALGGAPSPVRDAVTAKDPAFKPGRVIESTQRDGLVIYELFGPQGADPQGRKVEVRWDGTKAAILTEEWAH